MTDKEVMQMALDALEAENLQQGSEFSCNKAIEALRTALAQPDVVWHELSDKDADELKAAIEKEGRKPEPEPEPVAVWELQEGGWDTVADADWMETLPIGTKLYTEPLQREWVGLTDEEKKAIYEQADIEGWHDQPLLEAVEAKLKDKNA